MAKFSERWLFVALILAAAGFYLYMKKSASDALEESADFVTAAAEKWGVPVSWLQAVILTESSGNPRAFRQEAHDASYGLMQLLFGTAKWLGYTGDPDGLYDPAVNVDLGAKYLSQLMARWGMNFPAVYSAYNAGPANGQKYLTDPNVAAHVAHAVANLALVA